MKTCSKCKITKELIEFGNDKKRKDEKNIYCKKCISEKTKASSEKTKIYKKQYRENNKQKIIDGKKKHFIKNRETILEKNKEWRKENNDKVLLQKRKYYEDNKEHLIEYKHTHYLKHRTRYLKEQKDFYQTKEGKEKAVLCSQKRRALKVTTEDGTIGRKSLRKLFKSQDGKCKYCEGVLDFEVKYSVHLDHVIPLSRGGIHSITNVVYACADCNRRKHAKII